MRRIPDPRSVNTLCNALLFGLLAAFTASAVDPVRPFDPSPACAAEDSKALFAGREANDLGASKLESNDARPANSKSAEPEFVAPQTADEKPPARPPLPKGLSDYAISPAAGGGFEALAAIIIAAPRGIVRETLTDCGEALRYLPGMRLCKVLDSGPDYDVTRHKIKRYQLLPGADFIFRAQYHLPERIDVELLKGNLRRLNARWSFCRVDETTTRLVYQASIEANWYVPRRTERRMLERDLPEMLRRLKVQSEARSAMLSSLPDKPVEQNSPDEFQENPD